MQQDPQIGGSVTEKNMKDGSNMNSGSMYQDYKTLPALKVADLDDAQPTLGSHGNKSRKLKGGNMAQSQSLKNISLSQLDVNTKLDTTLIKAKQQKMESIKNVYAIQSRIQILHIEEDKMLKKIENERKKAEELQKVRRSYDEKMLQIRQASFDREMKRNEIFQQNQNFKSLNKLYINEKIEEIGKSKKQAHDELKKQKKQIEREKLKMQESYQNQKILNALAIKQQLIESKERMHFMKSQKDVMTKLSYIERVKEEKQNKKKTDKKAKSLKKIEQELLEKVKKTQEMYLNLKPFRDGPSQISLNSNANNRYSLLNANQDQL